MKILYVTATAAEAEVLSNVRNTGRINGLYKYGKLDIHVLITGIGSVSAIWKMNKWISENGRPDFAVNGGIAGSFSDALVIGDVVMPVNECFADLGIEDHEDFLSLPEAGLADPDEFPFENGWINAGKDIIATFSYLEPARSVTVNTATGSAATCKRLRLKFNPDIETMEGAAFFYLCAMESIPFLAVRSISNRVEARNRGSWNIKLAFDNLSAKLYDVFLTLDLK